MMVYPEDKLSLDLRLALSNRPAEFVTLDLSHSTRESNLERLVVIRRRIGLREVANVQLRHPVYGWWLELCESHHGDNRALMFEQLKHCLEDGNTAQQQIDLLVTALDELMRGIRSRYEADRGAIEIVDILTGSR